MGFLIGHQLSANVLVLSLWMKGLLPCAFCGGEHVLTVVCAYGPNCSSKYPPFLVFLEKVLESAPTGDSIVLLGDFNAHVGNDSAT